MNSENRDHLLKPFRVSLHEEAGDKFQIIFECQAEDEDHAIEQAENAYPDGEILHVTRFCEGGSGFKYVIYSESEAAISLDNGYLDGGFWNNDVGWASVESATVFNENEVGTFDLPASSNMDAQWLATESLVERPIEPVHGPRGMG